MTNDLDAFLDNLPKPTTPEAEGLPPLTPEGLTAYVKANAKPLREGEKPAMRWDTLLTTYEKADCTTKQIEDVLDKAMDDGLLYEPILGILRVVE